MRLLLSRRHVFAASVAAALVRASAARAAEDPALAAAVVSSGRSPANVARDRYRHPAEALEFFGLRDNLTVLEIEAGNGYWTEILAPYLKIHGSYRVALPLGVAVPEKQQHVEAAYLKKLLNHPGYGNIQAVNLDMPASLAPASIDLVLSFRNLHDWMADGTAAKKLAVIYATLKRGGIFGIEDHRGLTTQPQDPKAKSGYVREDYAIAMIEKTGFKLAGVSQIGDNPLDTKLYPKGVWTLPPTLALGEFDRAKYLAIGESDRWTLKFVKPAN